MFQAVSIAEVRSGLGQHYTSVPNIMKVIEPLFLNDLREEYEKADTENKLKKLLNRIYKLKIFDPACGSGNFLIIAYKQLRLLEMEIIQKIQTLPGQHPFMMSQIQLQQFYGIEIDDFACEIATLSLWLAEHQMNRKFKEVFGDCKPSLPLSKSGNIVCGNATRLDWEKVCPKGVKGITKKEMEQKTLFELQNTKQLELQGTEYEIYILGNPPYAGAKKQTSEQRADMDYLYNGNIIKSKNIDYIFCWFAKAGKYINCKKMIKSAFVSTNSICQGEQVALAWPNILSDKYEIFFAHRSFKWNNNARKNAGVTCVIIGIQSIIKNTVKVIYMNNKRECAQNINAYLIDYKDLYIKANKQTISNFPDMSLGSTALDGDNLKLTVSDTNKIIHKNPNATNYIKPFISGGDYINGNKRYCLWIDENNCDDALKIDDIKQRVDNCKNWRKSKGRDAQKAVNTPYKFKYTKYRELPALIVPATSSENREYIPIGFISQDIVPDNGICVVYNPETILMGILSSRMHMVWVRAVAGRLKTDYRYSAELCYNTFPFPDITDKQKKNIEYYVNNILAEREKHSDKTMAELYDPDKMPQGLREAHHSLDLAIEKCYRQAPFESDEKRLEYLFKLYEIMTNPDKKLSTEEQLSLL